MELLICIDKYDIVKDRVIYYEKLFELARKISTIVVCHDIDSEKIYKVEGKYYISITASEECIKMLEKNSIISHSDILNEDQLADILEKGGLQEIPEENIYEFDGLHVKSKVNESCILI